MSKTTLQSLQDSIKDFVHAREWGQFHSPKNLSFALFVEAAEIAEIFTWASNESSVSVAREKYAEIRKEIADVFIYVLLLADKIGCDPIDAAWDKLSENEARYPISKAKGNAQKYTDLHKPEA